MSSAVDYFYDPVFFLDDFPALYFHAALSTAAPLLGTLP